MYHTAIGLCRILVLAVAAFFWTVSPGQAAGPGGGGGHGGGGGGHGGFGGGGHGGFGGGGHGGFGGRGSFGGGRGWGGAGMGHYYGGDRGLHDHDRGRGFHDRGRYYGGYYPGLYGYGSYPYYDFSNYPDYGYGGYSYQPSYYGSGTATDYDSSTSFQYGSSPTAPISDNTAHLTVRVPSDAQVWFENQATKHKGAVRNFVSPELTPGRDYTYDVRALWQQNGRAVEQKRQVEVRAGSNITIDFTKPAPGQPAASPSAGTPGL